jgi:hypothetical protein
MLIIGTKGMGMGLYSIALAFKMRRYFKNKTTIEVDKPGDFKDYILIDDERFIQEYRGE